MKRAISVSVAAMLMVMILLYAKMHWFVPVQGGENSLNIRGNTEGNEDGNAEDQTVLQVPMDAADRNMKVAGKGMSACALTGQEQVILHAYAEFIQQVCREDPDCVNWVKFDLVSIDDDTIPELAVIPSDSHADGVSLYVFQDGDTVGMGSFGSRGTFLFKPRGNLICSTFYNMGEGFASFCRIEGTESVELQVFHDCLVENSGFRELGDLYEVDGIQVTGEEYQEAWSAWEESFGELVLWGYGDALSVKGFDSTDDLYEVLCRRFFLANMQECADKNLPAVSMCFVQGRIGVEGFSVESLRPEILSKAGKPAWAGDSRLEEWKRVYLAYLMNEEKDYNYIDLCTFSLIYVDDDDIPELLIDTRSGAGGCYFLTFHGHELDVLRSGLSVTYIDRGGLVCDSDGRMGYYYDNVYAIRDGKWGFVDGGTWGDGPDGVQLDENGNIMEFYYWDGRELTQEEYETRLNAIYPAGQGIYPEQYYIRDEICSLLRTGAVATVGHRYELIVGDVTWKEAETLCREKGGYLATITSQEELWRIQEQMVAEEKTNITFFVGASDIQKDGSFVGYHWLEPGTEEGYDMLDLSNALWRPFWLEGEPSYSGLTEDGEKVSEDYVVLIYQESDGRCWLDDVPGNLLKTHPSYAGRVGYICEYGSAIGVNRTPVKFHFFIPVQFTIESWVGK